MKLNLTLAEKKKFRRKKFKISDIPTLNLLEIETILEVSSLRAKEIYALAIFQSIPSIGIKFAEDLIFMGFYALEELAAKDGAQLVEEYERKKGYWIDSCVEDQFRLAVHFANHPKSSKKWWDFTAERKRYRLENGYPPDRPKTPWHEVVKVKSSK